MQEHTFTTFTPQAAASYALNRGASYPTPLYDAILSYTLPRTTTSSASTSQTLVIDVGTGPGKVLYEFLPFFDAGVGTDSSEGMIQAAKADGRYSRAVQMGKDVRFQVCRAEDIAELGDLEGRADLIVVGMAAHWFDMDAFYAAAAKLLKPGGTLAMFTCSSEYAHPADPQHQELQRILSRLEDDMLGPYVLPGNMLSRNMYKDLPLPWTLSQPNPLFDQGSFTRQEWDAHGVPSAPALEDGTPGPFLFSESTTPEKLGQALGSASMVIRWREANKDAVERGEMEDCVDLTVRDLKTVLKDRPTGTFVHAPSCTLLMMKRGA